MDGAPREESVLGHLAASGIEFDDRGEHELKGIPAKWRLFTVND